MLLRLPWVKLRKMTSFQMNADMGTPVAGQSDIRRGFTPMTEPHVIENVE